MSQEKPFNDSKILQSYRWLIVALGSVALLISLARLDLRELGFSFVFFSIITLVFASRIVVQIPRVKGFISVSDTFIFLSILLFGGEAGILLAVADAFLPAYKLSKTRLTLLFNISVFAVSTFAAVWIPRLILGPLKGLSEQEFTSEYVVAICLMGFIQYVFNSGLIATGVALRAKKTVWQMWRENFLWTSITYFAG